MLYDRPYMRQSPYGSGTQKTSIVTTLIVITVAVFVLQQVLNVFFPGAGGAGEPVSHRLVRLEWA